MTVQLQLGLVQLAMGNLSHVLDLPRTQHDQANYLKLPIAYIGNLRFDNMNKKLHKQRVERLRKLKGTYFSVYFGSTRRLNQLKYALKDAGFTVTNNNWNKQNHFICYPDGDALTHTHAGSPIGMKATVVV